MRILSASETRQVLPFRPLIETLRSVTKEFDQGHIVCPERLVVPTLGKKGVILSMVACSTDIMAHKLLTIFASNKEKPTLQGQVTCLDAADGSFLFALDGITVTERRTAAISLLALEIFQPQNLKSVLLIGTGAQAKVHLEALNELYSGLTVFIRGRTAQRVKAIVEGPYPNLTLIAEQNKEQHYDLVITLTSSKEVLYDQIPSPDTLVIGVGAYRPDMIEIGHQVVNQSLCVVDDLVGAPEEAGDIIQAQKEWKDVRKLSDFLENTQPISQPIFFKSVGCAAWDLAACRLALKKIDLTTR